MPATYTRTEFEGLVVISPRVFSDERGCFFESYRRSEYVAEGIVEDFVQDNHSVSTRGVLRGLHFQRSPHAQGKLVRVIRGLVWDVAVDLRPESKTFGKWFGLELSSENRLQFFIPAGFAHGFLTLSDEAEFCYKCTKEYNKASEDGIVWNDPLIGISWPMIGVEIRVSDKDAQFPRFTSASASL